MVVVVVVVGRKRRKPHPVGREEGDLRAVEVTFRDAPLDKAPPPPSTNPSLSITCRYPLGLDRLLLLVPAASSQQAPFGAGAVAVRDRDWADAAGRMRRDEGQFN